MTGCAGKYLVKTYPSGAKVYTQDLQTKDKKLIGLSPVQIDEESQLGDVFFVVLEKEKYKPKTVMVRVNSGESISIAAQLDPVNPDDMDPRKQLAENEEQKDDKKDEGQQQQPQQAKKDDEKKKDEDELERVKAEVAELNLRVALIENTTAFYKDAIFSPRFANGGQARFDRDNNEVVINNMFDAQQAIAKNDLKKAEALVDKAIEKDAYVTNAWLLKGSINFLKKDYKNAKQAWERSLELDPYNQMALKYLNNVYKKLGEDELRVPTSLRAPSSVKDIMLRRKVKR